jgi:hypothetical protein
VKLGAELRQYHLMEHPNLEGLSGMIGYPVSGDDTVTSKMTGYVPNVIAREERPKQSPGLSLSGTEPSESNAEIASGKNPRNDATGRVYINELQYFTNVPLVAQEFFIGGYQPAQKWLKDRKGRTLIFDDIQHYRKIIASLSETDRLMGEIDGDGN